MDISNAKFKSPRGFVKSVCTYYATLDIETSSNDVMAWSYQQGMAMFNSENGKLLEYKETRNILDMIDILVQLNNDLSDKGFLYIFIHNLSFDLTFFRTTLIKKIREVQPTAKYSELLTGNKEWLTFTIGSLEFRCSYRLTLMSLYTFTKTMNVKHIKLLGANDYGKYFTDTTLSTDFHKYLYNDVVGLGESIYKLMQIEGLTLRTLPLTSTGFIRNELKTAFKKDEDVIAATKSMKPCVHEFRLWNYAFKGGLNRVNATWLGRTVTGNIRHVDFVSHYPTLLLTRKYPTGKSEYFEFSYKTQEDVVKNSTWLKETAYSEDKLLVAKVKLVDYEVSDEKFNLFNDKTDTAFVCTPDLQSLYDFAELKDILPLEVYVYKAEHLPEQIINIIKKYFTSKSILKEKIKIAKHNNEATLLELEAEYSRAKAKLNGIGGLLQQKPMTDTYIVDELGNSGDVIKFDLDNIEQVQTMLDNYYGTKGTRSKKGEIHKGRCFSLLHGVFMTAYGRQELLRACNCVGWDNVLYSDTDSLFYFTSDEIEKSLAELNKRYRKEAIDNGAYVDIEINGQTKRSYLSWLDDEGETIVRFKALSPKRYAYQSVEHGFKIVCSTIAKGSDLYEDEEHNARYRYTREMELCGLTESRELTEEDIINGFMNFKSGFVFKKCSSAAAIKHVTTAGYYDIDGHTQWVDNGTTILKQEIKLHNYHSNNVAQALEDYESTVVGYSLYKEETL